METAGTKSVDDILEMSFKAYDDGNHTLASEYYDEFILAQQRALELAQKAVINGDVHAVDRVIESFDRAKSMSAQRNIVEEEYFDKNTNIEPKKLNSIKVSFDSPEVKNSIQNHEMFNDILDNYNVELSNTEILEDFQEKENKKISEFNMIENHEEPKENTPENYIKHGMYAKAEDSARQLIRENKKNVNAKNWLGASLAHQKNFRDALKVFEGISKDNPNDAHSIFNQSKVHLRLGNFKKGWNLYEGGIKENLREIDTDYFKDKNSIWDGKTFNGTLLIYPEQGLGDQIMYGTILSDLQKTHEKISIKVDPRLKNLFKRSFPNVDVISVGEHFNTKTNCKKIALASLCKFYRNSIKSFKSSNFEKYIVSEENVEYIKDLMPQKPGLKIGISWHSFGDHFSKKSLGLSSRQVARITESDDNNFINLQYGNISENLNEINNQTSNPIYTIPGVNLTSDIENLSAIIENCDLIITIDNVTAQLAASLGKPVWVLLPYFSEMRWMEKTENSAWYSNALLLRQSHEGDWENVLSLIEQAF